MARFPSLMLTLSAWNAMTLRLLAMPKKSGGRSILFSRLPLVWPAWLDPAYIFFSNIHPTAFRDGFHLNNPNQAAVHKRIFDRLHNLGRLDLLAEPSVHLRPRHAPVLMDVPPHR